MCGDGRYDRQFIQRAEEEADDIVDSDFSIDENDEPISDTEGDEGQKKKRRLVTKAYKEPLPVQKKERKPKPPKEFSSEQKSGRQQEKSEEYERKSIRKSTAAKSAETAYRAKVRHLEKKKKPKKVVIEEHMPTQEELLQEAKATEEENLRSLEKYQRMESEKKIKRPFKKTISEPLIQYRSMRMPLIEEILAKTENVKEEQPQKYYERTFITVLNDPHDVVFKKIFNVKQPVLPPKKLKCAVTGMPAKYVDPVTCVPYHNSTCLKIIRLAYYDYLEHNGDKTNPMVSEFLKWFSANKDRLRKELLMSRQKNIFALNQ
ncbi:unnamed protein product [Acanthoscelides obtectus]|uniref:Vacuolar protein sorting-associated protein 72 homolog n=1 Tax=Acanthoscelides obtectus TaxID=200917 RepID=A0A9P0K1Z5_ACAOB|nr:unnamed protein product [Acanthoscelides obtectus]CAK1632089.1 Vacuolar protein sorting-associated protein 72 homolog [Acanthoscelides obtectus]